MLKSEFLSSRKPFKVNKSKSLKLDRQSMYFFVERFVFKTIVELAMRRYNIVGIIRKLRKESFVILNHNLV